jgi:hypothetical protein
MLPPFIFNKKKIKKSLTNHKKIANIILMNKKLIDLPVKLTC